MYLWDGLHCLRPQGFEDRGKWMRHNQSYRYSVRHLVWVGVLGLAASCQSGESALDQAAPAVPTYMALERTPIFYAPTSAPKVAGDRPGELITNVIGYRERGATFEVKDTIPGFRKVLFDTGAEGWIMDAVPTLRAENIEMATVYTDQEVFDGDGNALPGASVLAGQLLVTMGSRDGMAQINFGGNNLGFIPQSALSLDPEDIRVARLVEMARMFAAAQLPADVIDLFNKVRVRHSDSRLLPALAALVPEEVRDTPLEEVVEATSSPADTIISAQQQ